MIPLLTEQQGGIETDVEKDYLKICKNSHDVIRGKLRL
jgi:hypothetical protein